MRKVNYFMYLIKEETDHQRGLSNIQGTKKIWNLQIKQIWVHFPTLCDLGEVHYLRGHI